MVTKLSISLSIVIWFSSLNLYAQNISVGTITPEFNGSGGLSLDKVGNLYIGDFGD